MRKSIVIILISIFLFSGLASAESQTKIGYIDLSIAFEDYQRTKDLEKDLEKKGDIKQEERQKLVQDIKKMKEEIELMNKSAKEKKELEIENKIKILQEFDQQAKTDLIKERDNMVNDILKEMSDVIKEYGQKEGYLVILTNRVLLYGNTSIDLTTEIIKLLNERYNTSSKK